jgi:hypothetical protein
MDALTIVPPVIAVLALFISLLSWSDSRRRSRLAQHYGLVTAADRMIGENQELLRFHGIDPSTIEEEYGVTASELAYLLQSFNAGSVSYQIAHGEHRSDVRNGRVKPFKQGSYWYDILRNDATQRAFPLLQKLFDSRNPYMAACEATIRGLRSAAAPAVRRDESLLEG